jgi:hypothetical protein
VLSFLDEISRRIDAVHEVSPTAQFSGISTGATSRIEEAGPRKNTAFDEPRRDRAAFFSNGPIN